MKRDKKSISSSVMPVLFPMWLFAALVVVYALALTALSASEAAAVICALAPFGAWSAVCVLLKVKGRLNTGHIIAAVLLLGIAVRVVYILATPWNERQHDVFVFETQGHAGYIYTLMKTGRLPETNTGLFYHPPLHPFIMSVAGNMLAGVINTTEQVFEALQLLTAYYSLICAWVFLKILNCLRLRQSTRVLFFTIFSLHPSLIIFSGSINNDILCLLLSMCTVLYLLHWWEDQSMADALLMGLFLGLAMMTKVSAVTIAPIIAAVFIARLVKPSGKILRRQVLINELSFGALSIPLGMWYPVRNLIKFDQPFGYVMPIGTSHPLYCGDKSFFERFVAVPVWQIFKNPYCIPEEDYNVPLYTLRCSVFGEYSFDFPQWASATLLILNCVLILFCIFAAIYTLVKKHPKAMILTAVSIVSLLFFVWFNIRYPNGCSMDFRYISLCLGASLPVSAVFFDSIESGKKRIITAIPMVLFTALTVCLYLSTELFII